MKRKKEETKPKEVVFVKKGKDGRVIRTKTGYTKDELVEMAKVVSLGETIIKEVKKQLAGISSNIETVCKKVFWASQNDKNVLILGETGTGKQIIAEQIHKYSSRNRGKGKLVRIECTTIPEDKFESELFGVKGKRYTGVTEDYEGRIVKAEKGTLFLDEIGELPHPVQAKLLGLIETKRFYRLGDNKETACDFRLISATNRPLEKEIGSALQPAELSKNQPRVTFRADLYYRIAKVVIEISPLRERREDILPIFFHLIKRHYPDVDIRKLSMSWNTLYCLLMSDWWGNIRELESLIESKRVRQRKLDKETVYFPFEVDEQIRRVSSFQNKRYDMSDPLAVGWGDERINAVTFAKKLKSERRPPYWKLKEIGQITSVSDCLYFDIEKALVDEGRKLEALPKYEKLREEYQEEKRKLEEQREQHPTSLLGTLSNLGLDIPGLSQDTILGSLRSSRKQTTPASNDSLDALAKEGIQLSKVEKRYLEKFLEYHPIEKGKKGKSLLNRANMLGLKSDALERKIKKYLPSGSPKKSK